MNLINESKIKKVFYLVMVVFSLFFIGLLIKYFWPSLLAWKVGNSKDVSNYFLNVSFLVLAFGIFFLILAEVFWISLLSLFYGKKMQGFTLPPSFRRAVISLLAYNFLLWMASIFFNFCLYRFLMGGEILALSHVLLADTTQLRRHLKEF